MSKFKILIVRRCPKMNHNTKIVVLAEISKKTTHRFSEYDFRFSVL